jgi:hypothetical protein
MDGRGEFEYLDMPAPLGPEAELGVIDPRLHGTSKRPIEPVASGNGTHKRYTEDPLRSARGTTSCVLRGCSTD